MQYTTYATGGSRIAGVFAAYIAGDIPSAIPIKMSTEEFYCSFYIGNDNAGCAEIGGGMGAL